jgi:hypothetical protein
MLAGGKKLNIRQGIYLFIIVLLITFFRAVLQLLMPSSNSHPLPPSAVVQSGLIPIGFMIFGLLTFGLLTTVFVLIQDRLAGTRTKKGLIFGSLFGMMWALYLLEPVPHVEGLTLFDALAYPLADGITIVSLGLLLGRFVGTDSKGNRAVCISSSYPALLAVPFFFLAGRILSYTVFHIYSSYAERQFDTIVWASAVGLWISIMYLLLRPGIPDGSPLSKTTYFAVVIYGIDYFLFNLFMPLVFNYEICPIGALLSYADLLVRASMDILSVAVGVYVCEKMKFTYDYPKADLL